MAEFTEDWPLNDDGSRGTVDCVCVTESCDVTVEIQDGQVITFSCVTPANPVPVYTRRILTPGKISVLKDFFDMTAAIFTPDNTTDEKGTDMTDTKPKQYKSRTAPADVWEIIDHLVGRGLGTVPEDDRKECQDAIDQVHEEGFKND